MKQPTRAQVEIPIVGQQRREPTMLEAMEQAAANVEASSTKRLEAVKVIREWVAREPEAEQLLQAFMAVVNG